MGFDASAAPSAAAAAASIRPAPASTGSPLPTPAAARAATLVWRLSRRDAAAAAHISGRATGEPPSAPRPTPDSRSEPASIVPLGWAACAAGSAVITGTSATGATTCSTTAAAPAEPDESSAAPTAPITKASDTLARPTGALTAAWTSTAEDPAAAGEAGPGVSVKSGSFEAGTPNRTRPRLPAGTEAGSVAGSATPPSLVLVPLPSSATVVLDSASPARLSPTRWERATARASLGASTDCAAASAPESAEPRASAKQVGIAATADPTPTATAKAPTCPTYRAKPGGHAVSTRDTHRSIARPLPRTGRRHLTLPEFAFGTTIGSAISETSPQSDAQGPHAPRISRRYPSPAPIARENETGTHPEFARNAGEAERR